MNSTLSKLLQSVQKHARFLLVAYLFLLFTATHFPHKAEQQPSYLPLDKVFHLMAYSLLAMLVAMAMHRRSASVSGGALLVGISLVMLVGVVDELTQPLPPFHRVCDLADWIADSLGALAGYLGYLWARQSGVLPAEPAQPQAA